MFPSSRRADWLRIRLYSGRRTARFVCRVWEPARGRGASVSTKILSAGTYLAASCISGAFLNVTMPEKEMYKPNLKRLWQRRVFGEASGSRRSWCGILSNPQGVFGRIARVDDNGQAAFVGRLGYGRQSVDAAMTITFTPVIVQTGSPMPTIFGCLAASTISRW